MPLTDPVNLKREKMCIYLIQTVKVSRRLLERQEPEVELLLATQLPGRSFENGGRPRALLFVLGFSANNTEQKMKTLSR